MDANEIVKAGDRLKFSKKKAKMASANKTNSRDWGRGMACIGRTTECTMVQKNHYGPIPGVDVGTCWKFRVQVHSTIFRFILHFVFIYFPIMSLSSFMI